jgi:hypothetical protein
MHATIMTSKGQDRAINKNPNKSFQENLKINVYIVVMKMPLVVNGGRHFQLDHSLIKQSHHDITCIKSMLC